MRVIAFLSLIFGFMGMLFLDGQTFTHAVMGIIFGIAAIVGGLASARKDYVDEGRRWLGRVMAGLGLVLALFCSIQLPSAYQKQTRFNEISKKAHEIDTPPPSATAIIRVMVGNTSTARIDTNTYNMMQSNSVTEAFGSYDLAQHANESLGLAKLWDDSDQQVWRKINDSLSVRKGNAPALFDVEIQGIDHDLAVSIINDMCRYCCSKLTSVSVNDSVYEEVHVSVVQSAQ